MAANLFNPQGPTPPPQASAFDAVSRTTLPEAKASQRRGDAGGSSFADALMQAPPPRFAAAAAAQGKAALAAAAAGRGQNQAVIRDPAVGSGAFLSNALMHLNPDKASTAGSPAAGRALNQALAPGAPGLFPGKALAAAGARGQNQAAFVPGGALSLSKAAAASSAGGASEAKGLLATLAAGQSQSKGAASAAALNQIKAPPSGPALKAAASSPASPPAFAGPKATPSSELSSPSDNDALGKKAGLSGKKSGAASDDVAAVPAVALLTGQLQRLQASQISPLVSGNKFIGDALGSDEIVSFLNQPAALGDLAKNLGISADQLAESGLDAQQMITPVAMMKAFGIDPQRVSAELTQLKANLPLDGLTPYIARAQALSEQPTPGIDLAAAAPSPKAPAGVAAAAGLAAAALLQSETPPVGFAYVPAAPNALLDEATASTALQGSGVSLELNWDEPAPTTDLDELSPQALFAIMQGASKHQPVNARMDLRQDPVDQDRPQLQSVEIITVARREPDADDAATLVANALPDPALAADQALARADRGLSGDPARLKNASFDAFALLGDRLRSADTQTQTLTGPDTKASLGGDLSEQLLSRQLSNGQTSLAKDLLSNREATPGTSILRLTTEVTTIVPNADVSAQLAASDQRALLRSLAPTSQPAFEADPFESPTGKTGQAIDASELRLAMPLLSQALSAKDRASGDGEGGFDQQPDQQQSQDQQPKEVNLAARGSVGLTTPGAKQPSASSFATQVVQEPAVAMQARVDLMQKVMNHATILAKQGGGTVRLDMSSPELGPLELALHMNKDKIDVRVMTGSDRARDAIMADLNQLKGALAVQNVQLGKVEVGVGGRQQQPASAFAGGGQAGGGQKFSGSRQDQDSRSQAGLFGLSRVAPPPRQRLPVAMLNTQASDRSGITVRA